MNRTTEKAREAIGQVVGRDAPNGVVRRILAHELETWIT